MNDLTRQIIGILAISVIGFGFLWLISNTNNADEKECEEKCVELGLELFKAQGTGSNADCWCKDGEAVIQVY